MNIKQLLRDAREICKATGDLSKDATEMTKGITLWAFILMVEAAGLYHLATGFIGHGAERQSQPKTTVMFNRGSDNASWGDRPMGNDEVGATRTIYLVWQLTPHNLSAQTLHVVGNQALIKVEVEADADISDEETISMVMRQMAQTQQSEPKEKEKERKLLYLL